MKKERNTYFITYETINFTEYLLLLCKMMEAVSTDNELVAATENVA